MKEMRTVTKGVTMRYAMAKIQRQVHKVRRLSWRPCPMKAGRHQAHETGSGTGKASYFKPY